MNDYFALRDLVRASYDFSIRDMRFGTGQAFAYAYDEVEIIFRQGRFQRLCLIVALFCCAKRDKIEMPDDDLFTRDVLAELRSEVDFFDSDEHSEYRETRFSNDSFRDDLLMVRSKYLNQ